MNVIICDIPEGTRREEFKPFPGSDDAIDRGCTCPYQSMWPQKMMFSLDCPIHELEKVGN